MSHNTGTDIVRAVDKGARLFGWFSSIVQQPRPGLPSRGTLVLLRKKRVVAIGLYHSLAQ